MNAGFPENIVDTLVPFLQAITDVPEGAVYARMLGLSDPNGSIGLQPLDWMPGEIEMAGQLNFEPTDAVFSFVIQHVVKHADLEDGNRIHRQIAKDIRLMLYRDPALQVALRSLSEAGPSRTERFDGLRVTRQKFASNSISSLFIFMSATEFTVTTETI